MPHSILSNPFTLPFNYAYGYLFTNVYFLAAFVILLARLKSVSFRKLTTYGGRTEEKSEEETDVLSNPLDQQSLHAQRKELLSQFSEERRKKQHPTRFMVRNVLDVFKDFISIPFPRKYAFVLFYVTGLVTCLALYMGSRASRDLCAESASQAVRFQLSTTRNSTLPWEKETNDLEGVHRYASQLGLPSSETNAARHRFQQEVQSCHHFTRPLGGLTYTTIFLFASHCFIRLVECLWVQRFRSSGDTVSLFAVVAGMSFYVVASMACFGPVLHSPLFGAQESNFVYNGLFLRKHPIRSKGVLPFTEALQKASQHSAFQSGRMGPFCLALVHKDLSSLSSLERSLPRSVTLFYPLLRLALYSLIGWYGVVMGLQMKCHFELARLRKRSRLAGRDLKHENEIITRALAQINSKISDVEEHIVHGLGDTPGEAETLLSALPVGPETVPTPAVTTGMRNRKENATKTASSEEAEKKPPETESNFIKLGRDRRIWQYTLPKGFWFRRLREPHYVCEVVLYLILFVTQLVVSWLTVYNMVAFAGIFELTSVHPSIRRPVADLLLSTTIFSTPILLLLLFTAGNLSLTALEHKKFWSYVNRERQLLYTFYVASKAAQRGHDTQESKEVEFLLQPERYN